jgi:hypothetical protein
MAKNYKQGADADTSLVSVEVVRSTSKAHLLREAESGQEDWFPLSEIEEYTPADGDGVTVMDIPNWLLDAKGW